MPGHEHIASGADIVINGSDAKSYSIKGKVIEPNNNGYPGVKITTGGKTVKSDKNGNFEITDLPNGTYEVVATHGS